MATNSKLAVAAVGLLGLAACEAPQAVPQSAPSAAQTIEDLEARLYPPGSVEALCRSRRGLASSIMANRQAGVPMGSALAVARSSDPLIARQVEELVFAAYDQPDYASDAVQQRTITNFANDAEIACYNEQRG